MQSVCVSAQSQSIASKDLYSFLARSNASGILRGADVKKYPKLAAITAAHSDDAAVPQQAFDQKFDRYIASHALFFNSLDANKDGKLSVMEIAQKVPKLLVYFPYLDLNGDGAITFDELISSRVLLNLSEKNGNKSAVVEATHIHDTTSRSQKEGAAHDIESPFSSSEVTPFDAFVAAETARLKAFFSNDHQKDDAIPLERVVVTGSRGGGGDSSSGFYPVYGMWVSNQQSIASDGLDAAITDAMLCKGALAALAAVGCAAASLSCVAGSVVTFGAFSIPCVAFVIGVCGGAAGVAAMIAETCPAS